MIADRTVCVQCIGDIDCIQEIMCGFPVGQETPGRYWGLNCFCSLPPKGKTTNKVLSWSGQKVRSGFSIRCHGKHE